PALTRRTRPPAPVRRHSRPRTGTSRPAFVLDPERPPHREAYTVLVLVHVLDPAASPAATAAPHSYTCSWSCSTRKGGPAAKAAPCSDRKSKRLNSSHL